MTLIVITAIDNSLSYTKDPTKLSVNFRAETDRRENRTYPKNSERKNKILDMRTLTG